MNRFLAIGATGANRRSAIRVKPEFGLHTEYERQADAADERGPSFRRLLRSAVGQELGKVLRNRLGQTARGYPAQGNIGPVQISGRTVVAQRNGGE